MGILDKLFLRSARSLFFDDRPAPVGSSVNTGAVEALREIDAAIVAHDAWKNRLTEYLGGQNTKNLDPGQICHDNGCELGKWLNGKGMTTFGDNPAFTLLSSRHAKFHRVAAQVVLLHQCGHREQAHEILTTEYERASDGIKSMFKELRRSIK